MAEDQTETTWLSVRTALLAAPALVTALGTSPQTKIVRRAIPADVLPCIICPSVEMTDRGTDDSDAATVRLELHVWDRVEASVSVAGKPVQRAAYLKAQIKAALHWAPVGLRCTVESISGPIPDPEPEFVHYLVVVEVVSQHSAL